MTGYARQSAADIIPTEVVRAGPLNTEFNAIETALTHASGHSHSGATGEGAYVSLLSDADNDTKIEVEVTSDEDVVHVTVAGTDLLQISANELRKTTGATVSLGSSGNKFDAAYASVIGADTVTSSEVDVTTLVVATGGSATFNDVVVNAVGTPSAGTDAANKTYVDTQITSTLKLSTTSTSSVAMGTGDLSFTMADALPFVTGATLLVVRNGAETTHYMVGTVATLSTTSLVFSANLVVGSGTYTDWKITVSGLTGQTGATGAAGTNGSDGSDGADAELGGIALANIQMDGFILEAGPTEAQWAINDALTGTVQRAATEPDVQRYTLTGDATLDIMGPWYPGAMKALTAQVFQDGTGSRNFTPQLGGRLTRGNDLGTNNLDTYHSQGHVTVAENVASPTGRGWTLTCADGNDVHYIQSRRGPNTASPWDYVYAALVKAGANTTKGVVSLVSDTYAKGAYANFDLSGGGSITGAAANGAGTYLASGIIALTGLWDGWFVPWVAGDVGSEGGVDISGLLYLADSSGNLTFDSAGGQTMLFGGDVMYAGSTYLGFPLVPATSKDPTWASTEPAWASQAADTESRVSFILLPDGTFTASNWTGS